MSEYTEPTPTQRAARLVFWYESEVQNGGHLQYFENRGTERVEETIRALETLGAHGQALVLSGAAVGYLSGDRAPIHAVEEYARTVREGEFDPWDEAFGRCQPPLEKALERFLAENQAEFVAIQLLQSTALLC